MNIARFAEVNSAGSLIPVAAFAARVRVAGWRPLAIAWCLTQAMDDAVPARLARQRISMRPEYRRR